MRDPLPIHDILPALLASLEAHPRLVLEAPPGAGKTTQVPPALLDASWLAGRRILLLEPRRIAARAAAEFMAAERGERVGETVGYRIRNESRVSAATRIEVVTEGILTRLLQDDPELPGIGAILFDEFHERHLHGDLGAALALDAQANLREDLRLVVMSATLDGERIARWLDAPRLTSAGRSFPVRIEHPAPRANEAWPEPGWPFHMRRAVGDALAAGGGDVLVFLPGRREIDRAAGALADLDAEIVPLHGELALADQHAALRPSTDRRRVVLATNVAESSLTLPGIRAVVDSGLAREPRFDPNSGFTRLQTVMVAQASADQRAGRAGRLGPGICYRLWPQSKRLDPSRSAEIAQVELASLALELAAWGSEALPWLDAPPAGALAQARDLLRALGAFDTGDRITPLGRELLAFGAHPRLAAAAVRAKADERALAADAVALVEARSPLRGPGARSDDFRQRVAALAAWRRRDTRGARELGADTGALAALATSADAWRRRLRAGGEIADGGGTTTGDMLVHAFPDRVARQDPADPRRYQLANGRGARLFDDSALYGEPWLVAVDLRFDERDSLILAAAPIDETRLTREFPTRFRDERRVRWNRDTRAVEAFEERRFDAIVLTRRSVPARPEDAVPALVAAIRELGLDALPWSDAARELRLRVQSLRAWSPDLGLPDFSDAHLLATLDDWLAPYLAGKRRLDALQAEELSGALAARLDHAQRRALDEQAPLSVRVPSGLERRIVYAADALPVLAVKLQELFGLGDTPAIAGGRVPLMLHLLSPAGRPIQVTRDLRGFWERTYPEVKKELKGRYPRHPWPDDPWTAVATHRAKPRGT
ncbi:ATP-dependent helicase HrpB [Dokdonella sp. MW10]|uniref:ATP-dependent helicase HrpB n=1 Tax=Dokdonella sp. MW10 TaxID=2992926 RepID=UPI003F7FFD9C